MSGEINLIRRVEQKICCKLESCAKSPSLAPNSHLLCANLNAFENRKISPKKIAFIISWSLGDKSVALFSDPVDGYAAELIEKGEHKKIEKKAIRGIPKEADTSVKLKKYLSDTYVRLIPVSNGTVELSISHRLRGGLIDSALSADQDGTKEYFSALNLLEAELKQLFNPLVFKSVSRKLNELIESNQIGVNEGFGDCFQEISAPEELVKKLNRVNNLYTEIVKSATSLAQTEMLYAGYKADLRKIAEVIQPSYLIWPELEYFYSLHAIRALDNNLIGSFTTKVKNEDVDAFRDAVSSAIKGKDSNLIEQVATSKYEDLNTLLGQIIKRKPEEKTLFSEMFDFPNDCFLNKHVSYTDPKTLKQYSGSIQEVVGRGKHKTFRLSNGVELNLEKLREGFRVEVLKNTKYALWKAISSGILSSRIYLGWGSRSGENRIPKGEYVVNHGVRGLTGNKKIVFQKVGNAKIKYRVTVVEKSKKAERLIIEAFDPGYLASYSPSDECDINTFNRTYIAISKESLTSGRFSCDEVDEALILEEIEDESEKKLRSIEKIKILKLSVQEALLNAKNRDLFNQLLENLVENKLLSLNETLVPQSSPLTKIIKEISRIYLEELKVDVPYKQLLMELVNDANYYKYISKEQSVLLSKTMNLLGESNTHTKKMKDKDVIVFVGNTGSGKSTSIDYLLGADFEKFYNIAGDQVVRLKGDEKAYAKIGQALGRSETLYASVYPTEESPFLCDCPGFEDTRGGDFELCTNLSIDQMVMNVASIKSIVVTVPIQAFQIDKGNPIVALIETVRERFTDLFSLQSVRKNSNLFLLITKAGQVNPATKKGLPTRIDQLYREAQQDVAELLESQQTGELNSFDLEAAKKRKEIWQIIKLMKDKKRVNTVDVFDKLDRKDLLSVFSGGEVDKKSYNSAMNSMDMQVKFGKCIEAFSHTWTRLIFRRYFMDMPMAINRVSTAISSSNNKLKALQQQREKQQEAHEKLNSSYVQCKSIITSMLEALKKSEHSALDSDIRNQIKERVLQNQQDFLQQKTEQIDQIAQKILRLQNEKTELDEHNSASDRLLKRIKKDIREVEGEIKTLSEGVTKHFLTQYDYRKSDKMTVRDFKNYKEREEAFSKLEKLADDRYENERKISPKDYTGTLATTIFIDRDFRIVPTDPKLRKQFEKTRSVGKYEAIIEGEGFELDLGVKTRSDGKRVGYGFETHWKKGERIPWFKIFHKIPNVDLNEATIRNKDVELELLKKERDRCQIELIGGAKHSGLRTKVKALEKRISKAEKEKLRQEKFLSAEKEKKERSELGAMLNEEEVRLARLQLELSELSKFDEIDEEIDRVTSEIESLKAELVKKKREKKHLAMIIQNQRDVAMLLREFTGLAIELNKNSFRPRGEIQLECERFNEAYDDQSSGFEELIAVSKRELNL